MMYALDSSIRWELWRRGFFENFVRFGARKKIAYFFKAAIENGLVREDEVEGGQLNVILWYFHFPYVELHIVE